MGSPIRTGRNSCGSVRSPAAAIRASRRSSLAPATLKRSRKRSSCLGLIACTAKPRSCKASTTGPCGTSIATATEPEEPATETSQSHNAAKPAPPCGNARSPFTLPAAIENTNLVLLRTPVDAGKPAYCFICHDLVLVCYTSHHDACQNLYWRSKARLPTGHPSWPTRQGTSPTLVLGARVHMWLLPAGWPARTAYTGTGRA